MATIPIRRRAGFTLVEILTVVILVGIMMAISFQSFGNARDRSNNAAVDSNVRMVRQALLTYEADNERFPTHLNPPAITDVSPDAGAITAMLDKGQDRRYLPGNLLPKTPWGDSFQKNNLGVAATSAAKGLWKASAVVGTPGGSYSDAATVKLLSMPDPIGAGKKPPEGGTLGDDYITTNYGAVMYEVAGSRKFYVLYGVGKRRGDAVVVAASSNQN